MLVKKITLQKIKSIGFEPNDPTYLTCVYMHKPHKRNSNNTIKKQIPFRFTRGKRQGVYELPDASPSSHNKATWYT